MVQPLSISLSATFLRKEGKWEIFSSPTKALLLSTVSVFGSCVNVPQNKSLHISHSAENAAIAMQRVIFMHSTHSTLHKCLIFHLQKLAKYQKKIESFGSLHLATHRC